MIENVEKFVKALEEDQELAKKFEEALKNVVEAKEAKSDAEAFSKAAQALGFELTISDIEKTQAETQELDPTELDNLLLGILACMVCRLSVLHGLHQQRQNCKAGDTGNLCFWPVEYIDFVYHTGKLWPWPENVRAF